MEIRTKVNGKALIVRLKGELDLSTVDNFKEKVIALMKEKDLLNLVINFNKVKFVDSSGLGAILGRYRTIDKEGGRVMLVGLKPQVKKIFKMAGLLNIMDEYDDEIGALQELEEEEND